MCLLVFLMAYDLSPFCSVTGCLCLFCIRRYVSDCFPVPSSSVAHSFIFFLLPPGFFSFFFLFFFFNQMCCSILLFHSVSLTVSSVVLWGTGMSVSKSHASVFCKRRKCLHVKQKNKEDFSTLFSFMEEHKQSVISTESKCLTLSWSFRMVLLLVFRWLDYWKIDYIWTAYL